MIVVQNSIISDDVADCHFSCQLSLCRGMCCVEGDGGAPLLEEEIAPMERILPAVLPYMTDEGRRAVEQQGVAVRDKEGDLGTPLIDGGACAFTCYDSEGVALCAIERAFREGKTDFRKPVSCHLYPIRVDDYGEFQAVNYHRWEVCRGCAGEGKPLYQLLREPLERRFGNEWYAELIEQINIRNENEKR